MSAIDRPMKVIHIPYGYFPDPSGGTEFYVDSLTKHLNAGGVESVVAAPGQAAAEYVYEGQRVLRFPVSDVGVSLDHLYGEGDRAAATAFGQILDREHPEIVHLHSFTRGASVLLVREAKLRGTAVVFTYHTPTVSCQRGTLLHWGEEVCDGRLDVHRCASCTLHALGLGRAQSRVLGALPPKVGRLIGLGNLSGGGWTAIRMTQLVQLRHSAFRALMSEVDHIVVPRQWTKELLRCNGVPENKITVSPHGITQTTSLEDTPARLAAPTTDVLRVAYFGRLDRTKGVDILMVAVRSIPDAPLLLHVYGIAQDGSQEYVRHLKTLAGDDRRIMFADPVPGERVVPLLRDYDVLAVPSQCLETGPLVVLDAFSAGIPVVGSKLGGIAELVHHDVDGLLVDPRSVEAWGETLTRLASDRALLHRLRAGVRPPRGMDAVAGDMARVYSRVLAKAAEGRHPHPAGDALARP